MQCDKDVRDVGRRQQPKKLDGPVRFHQSEGARHLSIGRWTYRWGVQRQHIQHVWHILQVIIATVDAESWIDVDFHADTDMEGKSASWWSWRTLPKANNNNPNVCVRVDKQL